MLEVRVLGGSQASCDGTPLCFQTHKVLELLCLLLLERGRPMERSVIAERLWPSRPPGRARRSLSTTLWRLRQAIRAADLSAPEYVEARRRSLAFDTACPHRFDVAEFERHAVAGSQGSDPHAEGLLGELESAAGTYRGPLLEGTYSDWFLAERERLQLTFMRVLKRLLIRHKVSGAFDAAVAVGQRLLALDPLQEDVHREMMRCHVAAGQRARALAQYERCRGVLRSELNIEPMPETRALHMRIRSDGVRLHETAAVHDAPTPYEAALGRFRLALDALETSWEALQAVPVSANARTTSTLPPTPG
ncbi:BTAD domain-containing putative transcriptional regulator [Candidatus Bipolaricaulota bacterium]